MKALILRQDTDAAHATSRVLIDKGFQILCVETLAVAHTLIRVDTIDLLVMDERVAGQLTHAIALSGERRSPYLSVIMLTDRDGADTDDLYDLIPSLYALAGSGTSPDLLGRLALSAVSNLDEAIARVNRRTAAELYDNVPIEMAFDVSIPAIASQSNAHIAVSKQEIADFVAVHRATPLEKTQDVVIADISTVSRDRSTPRAFTESHALAAEIV